MGSGPGLLDELGMGRIKLALLVTLLSLQLSTILSQVTFPAESKCFHAKPCSGPLERFLLDKSSPLWHLDISLSFLSHLCVQSYLFVLIK
jgi:hypothetical protein